MNAAGHERITIIGGGASGVLLAVHLLRQPSSDLRVTLVERRGQFGQGVAYSARQRDHRVNVPARGMSAFADDPGHFYRWLQQTGEPLPDGDYTFVPRRLYGRYLEDVLREAAALRPGRLQVLSEEVLAIRQNPSGTDVALANGTSIAGHVGVLAVGHETQPARSRGIAVRVGADDDTPIDPYAKVMILGSGLSMVDAWIALAEADHRGPILVVSRNGLLPRGHRDVPPISIDAADVPFGTNLGYIMRWFRALVRETQAAGGDWRSVVDGLRPYNQRIWQSWSERTRRQFLRHVRPFWNVHRHRVPPHLHQRMVDAVASGQVTLIAGHFLDVSRHEDMARATIRRRGLPAEATETIDVARVYDCGGVSVDVRASSNPVIRDLVASGAARPDALNIGLDVTTTCDVIPAEGAVSGRLFAVGPLTRGRFFEIEAIPDIRVQCATLARRLATGS
ncbi:FAD-dependent oxidoreductase [Arsenicitalea aurantiaca]|uniref:FAD-dependent oxidoreductase n=1 Tax=Arsenicitalea aurantiaca TaxID=1783274 RepID=A0A433XFB8_9HYPH|nr:FAD/NAD(P)-binding protein [Arsenicitalea aurantiaca]RUT32783.1 FAD-dependent oxidoreductase [Arsenicitalea aurantiaca]